MGLRKHNQVQQATNRHLKHPDKPRKQSMFTPRITKNAVGATSIEPDGTIVVVSPSATGQGLHTRWQYTPATSEPLVSIHEASSFSSLSSGSTLSDSSSLHSLPDHTHLQSIPDSREPITQTTRIIFALDSFSADAVHMREGLQAKQSETQFWAQWDALQMQKQEREMDFHELASSECGTKSFREAPEPAQEDTVNNGPGAGPRRGKPLGPEGTEIIDDTFRAQPSEPLIYPREWAEKPSTGPRGGLTWQPTEQFI